MADAAPLTPEQVAELTGNPEGGPVLADPASFEDSIPVDDEQPETSAVVTEDAETTDEAADTTTADAEATDEAPADGETDAADEPADEYADLDALIERAKAQFSGAQQTGDTPAPKPKASAAITQAIEGLGKWAEAVKAEGIDAAPVVAALKAIAEHVAPVADKAEDYDRAAAAVHQQNIERAYVATHAVIRKFSSRPEVYGDSPFANRDTIKMTRLVSDLAVKLLPPTGEVTDDHRKAAVQAAERYIDQLRGKTTTKATGKAPAKAAAQSKPASKAPAPAATTNKPKPRPASTRYAGPNAKALEAEDRFFARVSAQSL